MRRTVLRALAIALPAVLAATVGGGTPATAQEAPSPLLEVLEPEVFEPEVFVPGQVNRTPEGGPIPADAELSDSRPGSVLAPGTEVVERRTEDSRTVVADDGAFETTVFDAPIHFQDANGAWQPVDSSLVPAGPGEGAGLRSAAGPVEVVLPPVLGVGAVTVAQDDLSVSFTLQGAGGTPALGRPDVLGMPVPAAPEPEPEVPGADSDTTATYYDALPGWMWPTPPCPRG